MSKSVLIPESVIDGTGSTPLARHAVVIDGQQIAAVVPVAELSTEDAAAALKLPGKTVIPGLINNHVHLVLVPSTEDGLRAALAETHRRYTRRVNSREGWQGHLWQDRFASFPLDDAHLWAAVRYVERNPVRAKLVSQPEAWRWSSARAHLAGEDDGLVTVAPLLERFEDWSAYLAASEDGDVEPLRQHARTGRPLGDAGFVAKLEALTGRPLAKRRPGPAARES